MSDDYATRLNNACDDAVAGAARMRMQLAGKLGNAGLDDKRANAWAAYGFPATVTDGQLRLLFKRNGIARGVVELIVDGCWQTEPWLIVGDEFDNKRKETADEKVLRLTLQRVGFWQAFHEADTRALVSGCSGLLLDFGKNSGNLEQPVSGRRGLVGIQPVWKAAMKPSLRNALGGVDTWTIELAAEEGAEKKQVTVHRDRLFVIGDYFDGESILEANYNDYVNLEKITGGSGESYLKNASRTIHLDYTTGPGMTKLEDIAKAHGVKPHDLKEKLNKTGRDVNDGLDTMLITQGATANTLVATVPAPKEHFEININSIAARTGLPQRAIIGNQTGERASTEDNITLNRRAQGRRLRDLNPIIFRLASHLMTLRAIPVWAEFSVMWDDLTTPTIEARLANAKTMGEINATSLDGAVFELNEIREEAGYDPITAPRSLPDDRDDLTDGPAA